MKSQGWISIPRNLRNSWIWDKPQNVVMWIEMVMMANWEDSEVVFCDKEFPLKKGEFVTSIRRLASRLGCSKQKLSSFLKLLESRGEITKVSSGKYTIITILHYEEYYQPSNTKKSRVSDIMAKISSLMAELEKEEEIEESGNDDTEDADNDAGQSENTTSVQTSTRRTDTKKVQKSGHIKEYKEIKKEKESSSISLLRDQNLKFYDEIRSNEDFWKDASNALKTDIPKLKQKGE